MSSSAPVQLRITLRQSVALVWRTLRSMRTALILLLLLAMAAVVGSFIPQIPNSPLKVEQYQVDHPFWGQFYRRAGFFDVFGSWWFSFITTLLFVSLVACLVPRTRAHLRNLRQRPVQAREIDSFPQYAERRVAAAPDEAIAASQKVLRHRMFRLNRAADRPAIAAEKGAARELGSLVFHWAFLLIIVGVMYGKGTGFTGTAYIVEGQTWTDAAENYDGTLREGRFFSGDFTGTQIRLRSFEDTYRQTGQPMDFVSRVDLLSAGGAPLGQADIRVNHPADVNGLRIYQFGYGWAPVITISDGGQVLFDGPVVMTQETAPDGIAQLAMPWNGIAKLPTLQPQVGLKITLWPDLSVFLSGQPIPMTQARDPILQVSAFRGPLTDPSLRALDTSTMQPWGGGLIVGQGQTKLLGADGDGSKIRMAFPDLRKYSVIEVSRDRGVWIVLLAAILILLGLLPALYSSRRKVWVRAEANGAGTVLKVGGFALQRKAQFEEEFAKLVDQLARASGEVAPVEREKAGAR
jgi:cytochrome c biogenesis protein